MNLAEVLGCFLVFLCVAIMFLETIKGEGSVKIREFNILLWIGMIAMLILIYNFDPRETIRFDINEHFKTLDALRSGGLKYAFGECEYKNLYVTVIYFYLISLIGNYRLLPMLPVLIEFLILKYILNDRLRDDGKTTVRFSDISYTVYVFITTFGLMLAITGIRCVCAVSIAVLAVYLEFVKKKKNILVYLLYVIPFFIHSFSLIVLAIRIFAVMKRKKAITVFLVICVVAVPYLAEILTGIFHSGYLGYTMDLIMKYWTSRNLINWFQSVSNSTRTILICFYIALMYFTYIVRVISPFEDRFTKEEKNILMLAKAASYASLIFVFNYLFTERYMYVIAYMFVMIMPLYHKYRRRTLSNNLINLGTGCVLLWLFFFHDLYMFLVNFTGVYFLAA